MEHDCRIVWPVAVYRPLSSSAATAGAAGVATDVAQAIGFAAAVRVAAVIAVVGFVASLVYAHRESHMSH